MTQAVVAVVVLVLLFSQCGKQQCVPGIEQACALEWHVQVCAEDGRSFGPCHVPAQPAKVENVKGWEEFASRKRDEKLRRQREFK